MSTVTHFYLQLCLPSPISTFNKPHLQLCLPSPISTFSYVYCHPFLPSVMSTVTHFYLQLCLPSPISTFSYVYRHPSSPHKAEEMKAGRCRVGFVAPAVPCTPNRGRTHCLFSLFSLFSNSPIGRVFTAHGLQSQCQRVSSRVWLENARATTRLPGSSSAGSGRCEICHSAN